MTKEYIKKSEKFWRNTGLIMIWSLMCIYAAHPTGVAVLCGSVLFVAAIKLLWIRFKINSSEEEK